MNSVESPRTVMAAHHDSPSAEWMTILRLVCLVITVVGLSGCGIWREAPTTQTKIEPADIHQDDKTRTIDISYRIAGIDWDRQDRVLDHCQQTIDQEFEDCGYILHETPWASVVGNHAKLQVEIEQNSDVLLPVLSFLTAGVVPEIANNFTLITVRAYTGRTTKVYAERVLVKTSRWCPLICYIRPSFVLCEKEERAGICEVVRILVRRLREDQMLTALEQPTLR